MSTLIRVCLIAVLISAGSLRAELQELEDDRGASDSVEETEPAQPVVFETSTVWARPIANSTSAITIIGRDEIDRLDVLSVAELIRFVPGLNTTGTGSRSSLEAAQIRGGDPNFTIVLLDGMPLNDSTDQLGGAVNLGSIPVSEIERIEVVRGPLSSFYGSSALGGAINIITRRPENQGKDYELRGSVGNKSVLEGAASVASKGSNRSYFLGASWNQEAGMILDDTFEQINVQGNYLHEFSDRNQVQISGRVSAWETEDYSEGSGGPSLGTGDTRMSDHQELSLVANWDLGTRNERQRVSGRVYQHDFSRNSPAVGFLIPPSTEDTSYLHWQLGWAYPVVKSTDTELTVGLQLDGEDGKNTSSFGEFLDGDYELERITGSGLIEIVRDRGRWLLELGARVDVPEDFDTEVSPRFGVAYRLTQNSRIRGTLARAFKLPSFFALGSPELLGGNPSLQPEIALGGDLGLEHSIPDQKIDFSIGLFYTQYKDLIDFLFDPAPQLVNRSKVEAKGTELAVRWSPTPGLGINGNLTWQDVEDTETSEVLRNRPKWLGGLSLYWDPLERLRWEVDGQWVSSRVDRQIPSDRTMVGGYQLVGTALSLDLGRSWFADLRIDNLLNEEYETFIGFPGPSRSYRIGAGLRN